MSELRCPEECGGCPKCMGPAIELVEATERDEWKARAEKAEAALAEMESMAHRWRNGVEPLPANADQAGESIIHLLPFRLDKGLGVPKATHGDAA